MAAMPIPERCGIDQHGFAGLETAGGNHGVMGGDEDIWKAAASAQPRFSGTAISARGSARTYSACVAAACPITRWPMSPCNAVAERGNFTGKFNSADVGLAFQRRMLVEYLAAIEA